MTATAADVLAKGRSRLEAERARLKRAGEPRVRPPPGTIWNPTPTRYENNLKAANPSNVVARKVWDLSPIDPSSFDPTPGPSPGPPPTNTAPPQIAILTDLTVGEGLICPNGSWSGSGIAYSRQWYRAGAAIAGQTATTYTMVTDDIGLMIGCTVTAANANGATSADAAPVGPVLPAAPLRRRPDEP